MKKTEVVDLLPIVPIDDRLDNKLLDNSTCYLTGELDEETIGRVIKWIVYENYDKQDRVLTLYINSPGGDMYQMFALIDIMKASDLPIRTIGIGHIMSAAFLIFASGTHGQRIIAKNTGIMCHQYSDSPEGKHHDLKAQMEEGDRINKRMLDILCSATGMPASKIKTLLLRESDVFIGAEEAVKLGIADSVM